MYALSNCKIYTGSDVLTDHAVIIDNDQIQSVVPVTQLPEGIEVKDLDGANLSPGFIDLQLNGCGGVMLNDEITPETMQIMHEANLKSGCTSFLPTLITSSDEDMRAAITAAREYHNKYQNQSLGLHLEGPYLNVAKKGIHSVDFIRPSDDGMIDLICANADIIAKVTLAPEQNDPEHIARLKAAGIVVSISTRMQLMQKLAKVSMQASHSPLTYSTR